MTSSTSTTTSTGDPQEVLQRVFGYGAFRGPQESIVRHVLTGGSGLVLMPTGGGKSLCYQVPTLCLPGLTVVISPLIALMQDQVEGLRQAGARAAALPSALERAVSGDCTDFRGCWAAIRQAVAVPEVVVDAVVAQAQAANLPAGFIEMLA